MFVQPADLGNDLIAAHLHAAWNLEVDAIDYAPVGFGSHHWRVRSGDTEWFATVDDLRMGERDCSTLVAALTTAQALRSAGLAFVVAPISGRDGEVVVVIDSDSSTPHFLLALYPHVAGESSAFGRYQSHTERLAVIERLVAVHGATATVRPLAPVDTMTIPLRAELESAVAGGSTPWHGGPYSEQAHQIVLTHDAALADALLHYDELTSSVSESSDRFVITHGEPHRANTISTADGVMLIDWETCRLAPPERDLWSLIGEDAQAAHEYTVRTGIELDDEAISLYRLWWDLCEVSLFTADLRHEHDDTTETQIAWRGLQQHAGLVATRHPRPG